MTFDKRDTSFVEGAEVQVQPHLYWYDRPILFPLITDRGQEICILIDETTPMGDSNYGDDIFASVVISQDDLIKFVRGETDTRDIFEGVDNPRVFVWSGHQQAKIRYQNLASPLPEAYLSEKGAFLTFENADHYCKILTP